MTLRTVTIAFTACWLAAAPVRADVDIPTSTNCGQLMANSITNRLYAKCDNDLVEIDGATHAQRSMPFAGANLLGIDPIGNRVVALAAGITVVDVPTWTSTTYPIGSYYSAALDPAEGTIWVLRPSAGEVVRMDLATGATTSVPLGATASSGAISIDPVNDFVYVSLDSLRRIVEVDMDTLTTRFAILAAGFTPSSLAVDPLRQRLYVSTSGPALVTMDTVALATVGTPMFGDENLFLVGPDPGNDRFWVGSGQIFGCGGVTAFTASGPGSSGSVNGCIASQGSWAVDPATGRVHMTFGPFPGPGQTTGAGIAHWDADPPTAIANTALPSGNASGAAVMTSTSRVYVSHYSFLFPSGTVASIREHEEGESAPVPLVVAITNDAVEPDGDVVVHLEATSTFPTPLAIQQIYYQVDSVDGAWSAATPAGASATATIALTPGAHTIHAFAVDGQEATIGWIQHANPIVGPVASLGVTFTPPACSNGADDDGDGLTDYPADPGCPTATNTKENPKCDDDLDNDGDGGTDFDGGALALTPDAQCIGKPGRDRESSSGGCGLGAELVSLLPLLAFARRRSARAS